MNRWQMVLLAAAVLLPKLGTPAVDVGKLEPVQTVLAIGSDAGVELRTDTGAAGKGKTLSEAVEVLKTGAAKEVFLDTADFLLFRGEIPPVRQLLELFRPACGVCRAEPGIEPETVSAWLCQHPPGRTLGQLRAGLPETQELHWSEGRGELCPIRR